MRSVRIPQQPMPWSSEWVPCCPRTGRKFYTMATVPDQVVASWIPKRQMIGQVELFRAVLGLLAFREELANADDSTTSALIKGYSGRQEFVRLVGMYWTWNLKATQEMPRAGVATSEWLHQT
eukprot:2884014-Amphidinium_carterae.2